MGGRDFIEEGNFLWSDGSEVDLSISGSSINDDENVNWLYMDASGKWKAADNKATTKKYINVLSLPMIATKSFLSYCRAYICKKPDNKHTQINTPAECKKNCDAPWTKDGLLDTKSCYRLEKNTVAFANIPTLGSCSPNTLAKINSQLENAGIREA